MKVQGASKPFEGTVHRQLEGNSGALRNAEAGGVRLGEAMWVNDITKGENNIWKSIFKTYITPSSSEISK